ncbi:uncharacterized protein with PQ loop repeat [Flavobacterium sp. W4I14]|nr:uncharacterized protein with PQ loop repeat [Flavobacterium sp. W4I14]
MSNKTAYYSGINPFRLERQVADVRQGGTKKVIIMKDSQKLITISLIMFVVTALGITLWYINDHILLKFDAKSILMVLPRVGLPAGIITTLMFLLVVFSLNKIKNPFIITLVMSLIFIAFVVISYWFILHMIFYNIEDKKPFISQLLDF